jgi:hypothetical protein
MISCAIKKGNKMASPLQQNEVWRVDVIIVPDDMDYRIPKNLSAGLMSIEPVASWNIINSGQPQMLLLSFRVYDPRELQALREKLCATRMVRSINITSLSN